MYVTLAVHAREAPFARAFRALRVVRVREPNRRPPHIQGSRGRHLLAGFPPSSASSSKALARHFLWTMDGPASSYSSLVIQMEEEVGLKFASNRIARGVRLSVRDVPSLVTRLQPRHVR